MSTSSATGEVDPFHQLALRAWQTNRRRAEELTALVSELAAVQAGAAPDDGPLADRVVTEQRAMALSLSHEIIGSAGTFGHADVSDLARRMEDLLARLPGLPVSALTELTKMAEQILQALTHEPLTDG